MYHAKISRCSGWLPKNILSNYHLESILDTSNEWIIERTGIRQRHIAHAYLESSDLAINAVKKLIESAPSIEKVDCIIVATTTPDLYFPSIACKIQSVFFCEYEDINVFDIQAACSGFLYGLEIGNNFINTGKYKSVLLVGVDKMSKILSWKDRNTDILFGDGAGAAFLKRVDKDSRSKIIDININSSGNFFHYLKTNNIHDDSNIDMMGKEVFKQAVNKMSASVKKILASNFLEIQDIKFFVFHQANKRIIEYIAKILKLEQSQLVVTIDRHANTSSASIPLALSDLEKNSQIEAGDLILCTSFGAGFTWGSALISW